MSKEHQKTKSTFFEVLDSYLFTYVDKFLSSSLYQKVTDQVSDLGQKEQKFLNHGLTILFVLLPVLITGFFFYQGAQLRDELEMKKEILAKIQSFQQKNAKVNALGSQINSSISIRDKAKLQQVLNSRMSEKGIQRDKVTIMNYRKKTQTPSFAETSIKLNVKNLTMTELVNLMDIVVSEYKMKTTLIELKRNNQDRTIGGVLELMHYRRI